MQVEVKNHEPRARDCKLVVGEIFNILMSRGVSDTWPPPSPAPLLPLSVGAKEKANGQPGDCTDCEWGREDSRVVGPWPDPQEEASYWTGQVRPHSAVSAVGWGVWVAPSRAFWGGVRFRPVRRRGLS